MRTVKIVRLLLSTYDGHCESVVVAETRVLAQLVAWRELGLFSVPQGSARTTVMFEYSGDTQVDDATPLDPVLERLVAALEAMTAELRVAV